jgi:chromosome partitioning protein
VARVLCVVSQKGGVGKTTTAINLAAAFAHRGIKTLLVDTDPQGAVRFGVGASKESAPLGLSDYLAGRAALHQVVHGTSLPWLRVLLAGHPKDAAEQAEFERRMGEEGSLEAVVQRATERGHLVVIDAPPGLGPVTQRVLEASHHAIVPLQCEPLALQTTSQLLQTLRALTERRPDLSLEGLLLTMYDAASPVSVKIASFVREQLPQGLVFDVAIPRSQAISESFAAGQPLVTRTPGDPAAQAYLTIAAQLAARLS